jgi:hypothetical protein
MAQAQRDRPDLDLWVLVASRSVGQQLHQALTDEATGRGLEFRSITTGGAGSLSLEALLASGIDVVVRFLRSAPQADIDRARELLRQTLDGSDFPSRQAALKDAFAAASIGYDHWLTRQAEELGRCFSSPDRSLIAFGGQVITVTGSLDKLVPRTPVSAALDRWWSSWPTQPRANVVLGEEGDGKTWAVAAWAAQRSLLGKTVFVNAKAANSRIPAELLAHAVSSLFEDNAPEQWRRRFDRWVKHASGAPSVLLVLDGLNEGHEPPWWRELFDRLQGEPWAHNVATIVTCRTSYWRQYFAHVDSLRIVANEIGPFSETELAQALARHGLASSDFDDELLPLLRKPRYLAMAVRYRERVMLAGDFTVARLLYEDAKDRYQRKRGALDDQSFQSVLTELARRARMGERTSPSDVVQLLPPHAQSHESLTDLITGGVLEQRAGRAQIVESRLPLALGLLLAEDVREAAAEGRQDLTNVIQAALEPEPGIPMKAAICELATLHALNSTHFTDDICVALLDAWALLQNAPGRDEHFAAYFPCRPTAYFMLAEFRWADSDFRVEMHRLLMNTFLRWRDLDPISWTPRKRRIWGPWSDGSDVRLRESSRLRRSGWSGRVAGRSARWQRASI